MRVSDAERAEVAELLGRHYSDGRLDKQELDERVARAMSAKTRGDLNGLFDDLPGLDDQAGADGGRDRDGAPGGLAAGPYRVGRRSRGQVHPLLVVVAAVIVVSMAWSFLVHLFIPWPAIVALVIVVAVVSRRGRYRRR
jgi:hypothetical protein